MKENKEKEVPGSRQWKKHRKQECISNKHSNKSDVISGKRTYCDAILGSFSFLQLVLYKSSFMFYILDTVRKHLFIIQNQNQTFISD